MIMGDRPTLRGYDAERSHTEQPEQGSNEQRQEESVKLAPRDRSRNHEAVLETLQREINEGRLKSGDRLPPERQLSQMLGVSRASVREAIRVLEALEIVRVTRGQGPDAGSIILNGPTGAMGRFLRVHVALDHFSVDDVMEARRAIEVKAAVLAAQQASDEHLRALEELLDQMEQPDLDAETFHTLDTQFHVSIADASGNRLLSYLMRSIRDAVKAEVAPHHDTEHSPENVDAIRRQHRAILDALLARNTAKAEERALGHIERYGVS